MDERTVEIPVEEYNKLLNTETMMCRLALSQSALIKFIEDLHNMTVEDWSTPAKYYALKYTLDNALPLLDTLK
nr:MAG TPA: hypothetical protein [Caudoviricetes sp.]